MIRIAHIGLGPLGVKIQQYVEQRKSMQTVAAVDINPDLVGLDLGELIKSKPNGIKIQSSLNKITNLDKIDVAILTTSSAFSQISSQILEILDLGIPIVSTCEELTYPWKHDSQTSKMIDEKAKSKNVAVVSTGVNPGFLMDTLPSMLTGVCNRVDEIRVNRIQDAQTRRLPFQKKIGAGLSLKAFENKKKEGTLRHVGLAESMEFIANAVGWKLDKTEDIISPIIAEKQIDTPQMNIESGMAMGVRQVGRGFCNGEARIKLVFEAAVGLGESYDEIKILGQPNINSRIEGGVHGDIATCSIVLNALPNILETTPGLKTMGDISLVSFTN